MKLNNSANLMGFRYLRALDRFVAEPYPLISEDAKRKAAGGERHYHRFS